MHLLKLQFFQDIFTFFSFYPVSFFQELLELQYLAERGRELQQTVVAEVEAQDVAELLLDEAVVHQAGQRVQLVARQVQQPDPLLLFGKSRRVFP